MDVKTTPLIPISKPLVEIEKQKDVKPLVPTEPTPEIKNERRVDVRV